MRGQLYTSNILRILTDTRSDRTDGKLHRKCTFASVDVLIAHVSIDKQVIIDVFSSVMTYRQLRL
jgi:hypothetical protein